MTATAPTPAPPREPRPGVSAGGNGLALDRSDPFLLHVRGLKTYFPIHRGLFQRVVGHVKAVDDVSFRLRRGRTLGLVGESGCGKTTVARTILRLIPPTAGQVLFNGLDLFGVPPGQLRRLRRHMQIIFQDPYSSLNPRMTVGRIVGEAIGVHGLARGQALQDKVADTLAKVGLSSAYLNRYPHEFSGGQRQRIGIARALALDPELVICDEPVSALDVSIQSQILNLLADLRDQMKLTYLFVAHNLAVVEHFCEDVAVMYLGRIVEQAPRNAIYYHTRHPYTQALLSAAPQPDPKANRQRIILQGEVPSPAKPPTGCAFHPRCPLALRLGQGMGPGETVPIRIGESTGAVPRRCAAERPALRPIPGTLPADSPDEHLAACHYAEEMAKGA